LPLVSVHITFPFIFPANPLKTSSPPFLRSVIDRRQVHNVAMMNFRAGNLTSVRPFSFAFIRGKVGFEKNKKNSQNEVNPTSEKYQARLSDLRPEEKYLLPYEPKMLLKTIRSCPRRRSRNVIASTTCHEGGTTQQ
jgi:hypothetical protein